MNIIHDDCLHAMASMEPNSIDAIITDPPYGLSIMGKGWDHGAPGVPYWQAALRVAKPGAMLLAFGGTRTFHRLACAIEDAGWEIRDCLMWLYGSGFPKSFNIAKATGDPRWDGWGTALKPAWEPILLAMKPCDGAYAVNATKHGVAGLNIDGCRVESGRWPANVILDEEAGALLDQQTGTLTSGRGAVKKKSAAGSQGNALGKESRPVGTEIPCYGDSGGASRFFYCAKASKKERGEGNHHPTVKPLALMWYLVRLTKTPTGGVVLDPFAGSGATGLACAAEGRDCLLIEQDAAYCNIIRHRIAA